MPWQIVSHDLLDQFANQLTSQASLVSNEAARLDRVSRMAGAAGRRILKVKQDRNDARGEMIQTASQRVAELQSMMTSLETGGAMRVRVWVQWPDSEQTLFTTDQDSQQDDAAENEGGE